MNFIGTAITGEPDANDAFSIGEASDITILACSFETLSSGINAVNNYAAAYFQVYNSRFEDCSVGIFANEFENIHIVETEFLDVTLSGSQAVWFVDVNRAGLTSCTVEGFETNTEDVGALYLWNIGNMYLAGTDIIENKVGVYMEDVTALRIFGGEISGNDIGIKAPFNGFSGGANISNIFLFSHAKVNNNDIGIKVEKGGEIDEDEYYGMVLMDCAELYGNEVGITGEDVILQIDAYMNCGCDDPELLRPNKIHGNGLHFDICYVDLSDEISDNVPASGNYWGGTTDPGDVSSKIHVKKNNVGTGCITPGHILDLGEMIADEPTGCDDGGLAEPHEQPHTVNPGFTGNESEECIVEIDETEIEVHEEFIDAYDHFRGGWHTLAGQKFAPIASITGSDHLNASSMCKQYINVAKVMARGMPALALPTDEHDDVTESEDKVSALKADSEKDAFNMKVYPNPAKSQFTIELSEGKYTIRIIDFLGVERYSTKANSYLVVSTSGWPSGIYWIEARPYDPHDRVGRVVDLQSEKFTGGKVVVQ